MYAHDIFVQLSNLWGSIKRGCPYLQDPFCICLWERQVKKALKWQRGSQIERQEECELKNEGTERRVDRKVEGIRKERGTNQMDWGIKLLCHVYTKGPVRYVKYLQWSLTV